jgi:hypothetical protein
MKESINNVFLAGVLVKKDLEEVDADVKNEQGQVIGKDKALRGSLIIRTKDGSENEVKYYATRLTKKGTESSLFKGLKTVMDEYKALEQFPNEADIVKIGSGKIDIQDYVKEGELKSYNEVKANFVNRVEQKDLETTLQESKFEVEGVVETIVDEIKKDVPTGNKIINLMVIGYEGTLIPVRLTVPQPLVIPFSNAGFYDGGYAKFVGKLVNTKEINEVVEKMGFGEDNVRVVTTTIKRFEVTSGNPLGTPMDKGISIDEWNQAKAKRQLKLDKKKQEASNNSANSNPFGNASSNPPTSTATSNPFGGSNPFATK